MPVLQPEQHGSAIGHSGLCIGLEGIVSRGRTVTTWWLLTGFPMRKLSLIGRASCHRAARCTCVLAVARRNAECLERTGEQVELIFIARPAQQRQANLDPGPACWSASASR